MGYKVSKETQILDTMKVKMEVPRDFREEVEEFAKRNGIGMTALVKESIRARMAIDMAFEFVRAADADREKFVRALRTYLFDDCDDASPEEMAECFEACSLYHVRARS